MKNTLFPIQVLQLTCRLLLKILEIKIKILKFLLQNNRSKSRKWASLPTNQFNQGTKTQQNTVVLHSIIKRLPNSGLLMILIIFTRYIPSMVQNGPIFPKLWTSNQKIHIGIIISSRINSMAVYANF